jgi:hypothetical protein
MIDLWHLVKIYYYDPQTHGSNSIKAVLPAILNSSEYLKDKYSKPIYGAKNGIKSLNFKDWKWLELKDEKIIDPYKKLPQMFQDITDKNFDMLSRGIAPIKVMAMGGWKDLKTMQYYIRKARVDISGISDSLSLHNPNENLVLRMC